MNQECNEPGGQQSKISPPAGDQAERQSNPGSPTADKPFSPKRIPTRAIVIGAAGLFLLAAIAISVWTAWLVRDISFAEINPQSKERAIEISDAEGNPIYRSGAIGRLPLKLEEVPPSFVSALLAIEDRRFYEHHGVDPVGIVRAFVANTRAGDILQGGSTLTQQLVRAHYLNDDRTFRRKLREAVLSVWLDARHDKKAILEGYLNTVYFGSGAYGLAAAARRYFDKDVSNLTLAESAILAGLIRAPTRLNPLADLEASRRRAMLVLDAMVETGAIDREEFDRTEVELGSITPKSASARIAGSWYGDWVAGEVEQFLEDGEISGNTRSVHAHTPLDPSLQDLAQTIVTQVIAEQGPQHNATQAALVAMRIDGSVLALVGGTDYSKSQFNRAVQAERQPG